MKAESFTRSANPDTTIAIAIAANIPWNATNRRGGYPPDPASMPMPSRPIYWRFPINPPISCPNEREYPKSTHWMLTRAKTINERATIEMKFFRRTSPP